ncbi:MAG: hypothetical protein RCG15_01815 [Candidatus Rickettsia vulgarisii]
MPVIEEHFLKSTKEKKVLEISNKGIKERTISNDSVDVLIEFTENHIKVNTDLMGDEYVVVDNLHPNG